LPGHECLLAACDPSTIEESAFSQQAQRDLDTLSLALSMVIVAIRLQALRDG
jgi:hypothetical protein